MSESDLRTLGDSFRYFGLCPRLGQLEESLEQVRRNKRTPEEHERECKLFDKELQRLSREHHPDRVARRGGSEAELTQAKDLQTALNATRTVLTTLNKIFLEDIDVEHRYEFFTQLDIGHLGNEDEVENQAYQVLSKMCLISEIRQGTIVGEIRRFLGAGRRCVECYLQNDTADFKKYRSRAFFHLERCVTGYRKLLTEHEEVESECRSENLHNIYPTVQEMKRDCSKQLRHMEALLELSTRPFGELFPMYSRTLAVDEYFVLPFVCYTHVILACSVMSRESKLTKAGCLPSFRSGLGRSRIQDSSESSLEVDDLLYRLALCYGGNRQYKRFLKQLFEWNHMVKENLKGQFLEALGKVQVDLERRFKMEDYVEKGSHKHVLKEMKACREMLSEIVEKTRRVESDLQTISKNHEYVSKQLDKVMKSQVEVSRQLDKYHTDADLQKKSLQLGLDWRIRRRLN